MSQSKFNPIGLRERLVGPTGYEWSLQASLSEAKTTGGLGSSADAYLAKAIQCLLVGFDEPAERLLKRVKEWVQVAIETNERPQRYFAGATEAQRYQTLAICNWFLSNQHDLESLNQFVAQEDRYLDSVARKDKGGVSLILQTYVNAEAFERTLEIFDSTPGLSKPTSLSPRNEAQMAYILSRNHLGLQYTQEDIRTASTRFLTTNMDTWLSNGHWVSASEWIKIIHWNDTERTLSAKKTLMKCYDYLPNGTNRSTE